LGGTEPRQESEIVSRALAVNSAGQTVGLSLLAGNTIFHAFSWTKTGGMIDLGALGNSGSVAVKVNGSGTVIGASEVPGGVHAVLWRPLGPSPIISSLRAAVSTAGFQQGARLLQNALAAVERGDTAGACGPLAAFVNQVSAQRGKTLTVDQANELIASAMRARVALGCR
jgi:probable HAF family extracellular repeat protein